MATTDGARETLGSSATWYANHRLNQLVCPVEDLGDRPVGYSTAPWVGFGEALAAVAGALTGLLFVALSVKSDVLAASRSLSSRAVQTLVLSMISV